ncbi:RidA family protein [Nonomuraea sp. B5E05]|uniref:RidA family protein n=1 Tax=Nonomuraea sp. B5E05 TaxID=3153569 RepID=UPI003261B553
MSPENPFPADPDRAAIWTMLVDRDISAYVRNEWAMVEADYVSSSEFVSIDARRTSNPDSWRVGQNLAAYRDSWSAGSAELNAAVSADTLEAGLREATTLRDIEIHEGDAVAHKKFDGTIRRRDGGLVHLDWQTLYLCRQDAGRWRIRGFIGHLPNPMGDRSVASPAKELPAHATQHATAGPYSPVLTVRADRLVVVSGQAAIVPDGSIVGDDIEEQTHLTLQNCRRQLAFAGCTLADVVKVNAYLTDMATWERFNSVYRTYMPEPCPVRTVVGAALLDGLLVEVEMWAVAR